MSDVFISYKAEEYSYAKWIKEIFEKNGISCWLAPDDIPGGSNYARTIPTAIDNCQFFVLLLSSKAQESVFVSKEVNKAINSKKRIMPFMIEECQLIREFEFYLSDVQHYRAYLNVAEATRQLLTEIKDRLGEKTDNLYIPENDTFNNLKVHVSPSVEIPVQKPIEGPMEIPVDYTGSKTKAKHNLGLIWLIILTYLVCIPGGAITTISYIVGHSNTRFSNQIYKATRIMCIIAIVIGVVWFLAATANYSHWSEAYFISIIGTVIELMKM